MEDGKMEAYHLVRQKIRVNGINLFYRDTATEKPALLCLHGKWGRGETWSDFISWYEQCYRIIAPDQRGHGLSDKPIARYAAEDLAEDAYALIKALELDSVIVVGHSMGGRVGAYLSVKHPEVVNALVILDETAAGPEEISTLSPEEVSPIDKLTETWPAPYPTYDAVLEDLDERFSSESNIRYFLDSLYETEAGYDFMFSRYAMSAIGEYIQGWYHLLPKIDCPVCLVRAVESWCLPKDEAQKMRDLINDCTYFEVSGSDHMVYLDNPGEFYAQLGLFLQKIEKTPDQVK
jgi:2-succinyl-6-hydroxy-2,4-cyclohexadiene-1-carboxylate synthase